MPCFCFVFYLFTRIPWVFLTLSRFIRHFTKSLHTSHSPLSLTRRSTNHTRPEAVSCLIRRAAPQQDRLPDSNPLRGLSECECIHSLTKALSQEWLRASQLSPPWTTQVVHASRWQFSNQVKSQILILKKSKTAFFLMKFCIKNKVTPAQKRSGARDCLA